LKYARDDSSEVTKVETNTTPCLIIEGGGSVQNRYLAAAALRKKKALGLEEEKSEVTSLTDFNNKFGTTSASQSMIISSSDVKSNELANINSTGPASGYGTEEEAKVAEDGNVDDDDEEEEDDEDTERKEKDEVLAKLEAQTVETLTAALTLMNVPLALLIICFPSVLKHSSNSFIVFVLLFIFMQVAIFAFFANQFIVLLPLQTLIASSLLIFAMRFWNLNTKKTLDHET
jgi:cation transport ATPase